MAIIYKGDRQTFLNMPLDLRPEEIRHLVSCLPVERQALIERGGPSGFDDGLLCAVVLMAKIRPDQT